jgi:hypothetical protein
MSFSYITNLDENAVQFEGGLDIVEDLDKVGGLCIFKLLLLLY